MRGKEFVEKFRESGILEKYKVADLEGIYKKPGIMWVKSKTHETEVSNVFGFSWSISGKKIIFYGTDMNNSCRKIVAEIKYENIEEVIIKDYSKYCNVMIIIK